jgi:hypothetical protein
MKREKTLSLLNPKFQSFFGKLARAEKNLELNLYLYPGQFLNQVW